MKPITKRPWLNGIDFFFELGTAVLFFAALAVAAAFLGGLGACP